MVKPTSEIHTVSASQELYLSWLHCQPTAPKAIRPAIRGPFVLYSVRVPLQGNVLLCFTFTPWPHWIDRFSVRVREVFPMVSETPMSLYIFNVILSDIRNKWLGNPFTFSVSEQCGHFYIFLWNPHFSEDFSDSDRKSVSSVWPGRYLDAWRILGTRLKEVHRTRVQSAFLLCM